MTSVRFLAEKAKEVSSRIGLFSTDAKNDILLKIADRLDQNADKIVKANEIDMKKGRENGLSESYLDRLLFTHKRLTASTHDVRKVASLKDYVGEVMELRQLENGMFLKKVRVPLGVIGMIYEARPNVTIDAAVLCLKSGNAIILKGGSDALETNRAIVEVIREVLQEVTFLEPEARLQDAVQLIEQTDRVATHDLLGLVGIVDVIIPRGSKGLIDFVRENSKIPVIETGASVVHTYVHEDADLKKAVPIVLNAKLRRVSTCFTLDTLLIHQKQLQPFLEQFVKSLPKNSYKATRLEIRADSSSLKILEKIPAPKDFTLILRKVDAKDYEQEFLDYILAIKTVESLEDALMHISRYSLKHSEAIITEDRTTAEKFLNAVDAACVYWNASTQFSDGAQFGLGAEMGISTQKLHARGPFALEALTSYKWIIEGNGQIRP